MRTYCDTFEVLFPILEQMPDMMQDCIGDIVTTLQQRREVVR